ncbi:DUF6095 family protein [Olleya sp. R77988]|uniref:DUF6095 family protein n=1 Tax=Olleya sp. R77988 TaxID=3093875 RepID=UPI0037CC16CF
MKTKSTDKEILVKGIKYMIIALLLMFSEPLLLHTVLTNKEKPFYIILLIISIAICCLAIFFAFKGINTIINSLFKSNKSR